MSPVRRFILSAIDLLLFGIVVSLVGWDFRSFYLRNGEKALLSHWLYWVVLVALLYLFRVIAWDFYIYSLRVAKQMIEEKVFYGRFSISLLVTAGAFSLFGIYNYSSIPLIIGAIVLFGLYHKESKRAS